MSTHQASLQHEIRFDLRFAGESIYQVLALTSLLISDFPYVKEYDIDPGNAPGFVRSQLVFNHAPQNYDCPFCRLARGQDTSRSSQADVIWRDDNLTAFISAGWWPNNKGHVLIVPNRHFENIYDLPAELGEPIHRLAQQIALGFKELYNCDGVSTRQHNEPRGGQDVWHYHLHVFPRYENDNLYNTSRRDTTPEERLLYAEKLRTWPGFDGTH